MGKIKIIALVLLTLLVGCKTSSQKVDPLAPVALKSIDVPSTYTPAKAAVLTSEGENQQARYSPDGKNIIYQSHSRTKHQRSQIYVLNLESKHEKRITYNDGEDSSPTFESQGKKITYASTTDEALEEQEEGPAPQPTPSETSDRFKFPFLGYEIYESNADGSHIVRLTQSPGYDGEPVYSCDGRKIFFTSRREDQHSKILTMDTHGHNVHIILNQGGFYGEATVSPKGKQIAWIKYESDTSPIQIFISDTNGKHPKPLTTKAAIHWQPSFSPDGSKIIFSSNRDDPTNFEIYTVNTDGTCLRRLTYSDGADLFPTFSADGKEILFTSNRSGLNQIYEMDYIEPTACPAENQ